MSKTRQPLGFTYDQQPSGRRRISFLYFGECYRISFYSLTELGVRLGDMGFPWQFCAGLVRKARDCMIADMEHIACDSPGRVVEGERIASRQESAGAPGRISGAWWLWLAAVVVGLTWAAAWAWRQ